MKAGADYVAFRRPFIRTDGRKIPASQGRAGESSPGGRELFEIPCVAIGGRDHDARKRPAPLRRRAALIFLPCRPASGPHAAQGPCRRPVAAFQHGTFDEAGPARLYVFLTLGARRLPAGADSCRRPPRDGRHVFAPCGKKSRYIKARR